MNRRIIVLASMALFCPGGIRPKQRDPVRADLDRHRLCEQPERGRQARSRDVAIRKRPDADATLGDEGRRGSGWRLKAIFTLEGGYSVATGALSQGGREFGRQAFVGLSSDTFGTVTLGRQYDEAVTLCVFSSACQFAAYGAHIGDSDNVFDTFRINNAVQYKSIDYSGLQFEGLYGFSNKAGGFSDNNAYSAGVQYRNGPLSPAGFLQVNTPNDANNTNGAVVNDYGFTSPFITNPATNAGVSKQRMFGRGGAYVFGPANLSLLYTNARFDYLDTSRLTLQNFEVSLTDYVTPQLILGAAYIFTTGQYHPQDNSPKWHQVNTGVDYLLSKRTDLFLVGIYQKAAGDAQYAQIYIALPVHHQVANLGGGWTPA